MEKTKIAPEASGRSRKENVRESLILRYESEMRQLTRRLEKLKAGASPGDVILQSSFEGRGEAE